MDLRSWVTKELVTRTCFIRQNPTHIVQISAWRDPMTQMLSQSYPQAQHTCVHTLSAKSASQDQRFKIPVADESQDLALVCVSGVPHQLLLAEIMRVLRPAKLCLIAEIEDGGIECLRRQAFESQVMLEWPKTRASELAQACQDSGFEWPVLDTDRVVVPYEFFDGWLEQMRDAGYLNILKGDDARFVECFRSSLKGDQMQLESHIVFAHLIKTDKVKGKSLSMHKVGIPMIED